MTVVRRGDIWGFVSQLERGQCQQPPVSLYLDSRSCLLETQFILGHKVSSTFTRALRLQIFY